MKRDRTVGVAFTRKSFTNANGSFRVTAAPGSGKKITSRGFCAELMPVGQRDVRRIIKRRECCRDVLLDQVPERRREQEGDQLRAPVVQDQFLHKRLGAAVRRYVCGKFPG